MVKKYTFHSQNGYHVLHFVAELVELGEVDSFLLFLDGALDEVERNLPAERNRLVVDLRRVKTHRPGVVMKLVYPLTTRLGRIRALVSDCVCICPSAAIVSVCDWTTCLVQKLYWSKIPVRFLSEEDLDQAGELADLCQVAGLPRSEFGP